MVGCLVYVMRAPPGQRREKIPGIAWRVVSVNWAHGTLELRSVEYGTLSICQCRWFERTLAEGWLELESEGSLS